MGKVVGELKSKVVGVGFVDITVGETRVRCWDTNKRGNNIVPNPVREAVNSVRQGEMVEVEIIERKDAKGKVWTNLGSIAIVQGQADPDGQADQADPFNPAPAVQAAPTVYPVGRGLSIEAIALELYKVFVPAVLSVSPGDLAYEEENWPRRAAVINAYVQAGLVFISEQKNVVGE